MRARAVATAAPALAAPPQPRPATEAALLAHGLRGVFRVPVMPPTVVLARLAAHARAGVIAAAALETAKRLWRALLLKHPRPGHPGACGVLALAAAPTFAVARAPVSSAPATAIAVA